MKTLLPFLFVLILCLNSSNSFSSIRRICKVKYETEDGWSYEYRTEVTFITGKELNKATKSFHYSPFSNYCLIWFDDDEVAILEIKDFLTSVGEEFDREDFQHAFQVRSEISCTQVNNENNTEWKILAKDFTRYIDPRENQ